MAERTSRREFLKTAARWLLLAGLGAVAARLLRSRPGRGLRHGGEICVNDGLCRGCTAFKGCGLPQALSAKQRAPWARGRS
jgi:hypothetical protein